MIGGCCVQAAVKTLACTVPVVCMAYVDAKQDRVSQNGEQVSQLKPKIHEQADMRYAEKHFV